MLFSATFPKEIQRLAADFLHDYIFLTVSGTVYASARPYAVLFVTFAAPACLAAAAFLVGAVCAAVAVLLTAAAVASIEGASRACGRLLALCWCCVDAMQQQGF
jgi:hypothetical protein